MLLPRFSRACQPHCCRAPGPAAAHARGGAANNRPAVRTQTTTTEEGALRQHTVPTTRARSAHPVSTAATVTGPQLESWTPTTTTTTPPPPRTTTTTALASPDNRGGVQLPRASAAAISRTAPDHPASGSAGTTERSAPQRPHVHAVTSAAADTRGHPEPFVTPSSGPGYHHGMPAAMADERLSHDVARETSATGRKRSSWDRIVPGDGYMERLRRTKRPRNETII